MKYIIIIDKLNKILKKKSKNLKNDYRKYIFIYNITKWK